MDGFRDRRADIDCDGRVYFFEYSRLEYHVVSNVAEKNLLE